MGRRKFLVGVQESAIDGFTVLVTPREARKLKVGRPWTLEHQDAMTRVHPQWFFNSPDGYVQIGLRRMEDVTPVPRIRRSVFSRFFGPRYSTPRASALTLATIILVLFGFLAMPGIGDRLGTSPRIRAATRWIVFNVDRQLNDLFSSAKPSLR